METSSSSSSINIDDLLVRGGNGEVSCIDRFIGDEKCRALCAKIAGQYRGATNGSGTDADFSGVSRIVLRGNCIGVQGAQALADLLRSAAAPIQSLSLEWNQVGSPGTIFIASAIANNNTLTYLDLRNNGVGDEGACELATALVNNDSVRVVDLRWNQINDRGALAFEPILRNKARKQVSILLGGNLITTTVMTRIEEWMKNTEEVKRPPKEERPAAPTTDYSGLAMEINKEVQLLRIQVTELTQKNADLERQLDTSAVRVTELEHLLMREQFKSTQLDEALRHAKMRIVEQQNEKKSLTEGWDREREALGEEFRRRLDEKEVEALSLKAELDMWKTRSQKHQDTIAGLESQYERTNKSFAEERGRVAEEMKQMQTRITQLAIVENRLKAENHGLTAASARALERVEAMERETAESKRQANELIAAAQAQHAEEVRRLNVVHHESAQAAAQVIANQTAELAQLRAALNDATGSKSRLELEIQRRCEKAANDARAEEQRRAEASNSDLRQRLELMSTSKNELESRHSSAIGELIDLKTKHNNAIEDFQKLLQNLQDEVNELRSTNSGLREVLVTSEAENRHNASEISSLQKRLIVSEQRGEKLSFEFSKSSAEIVRLQELVTRLQGEVRDLESKRASEFGRICTRLESALGRELEAIRRDMSIQNSAP